MVKLSSSEEGVLREMLVERGDLVTEGQIVARLDSELESFSAEIARVRAEGELDVRSSAARLGSHQSEATQMERLRTESTLATKPLDEAVVESGEQEKRVMSLEYRHALARLEQRNIRSPINGVVIERNMAPGEYAQKQAIVMTIAQIDPLNVKVSLPISRYNRVAVGMPADVEPQAPIGGRHRARVTVVDRILDIDGGTFEVRLALPNPDGHLPAGLKCRVQFLPMTTEVAKLPENSWESGTVALDDPAPKVTIKDTEERSALILDIQRLLIETGQNPGRPDGKLGPRTRQAIETFQRELGLAIDGEPSTALKERLEAATELLAKLVAAPEIQAKEAPPIEVSATDSSEVLEAAEEPETDAAKTPEYGAQTWSPGWHPNLQMATEAIRRGAMEEAVALYSEVLDEGALPLSHQVLALTLRGSLLETIGRSAEAFVDLNQALEIDPENVLALSLRSSLHEKAGRMAEALADLDRALKIDPDNEWTLVHRGNIYLKQNLFGRALPDYDRALSLDPDMVEAYHGRALAHSWLGQDRRAIDDYDRVSKLDPNYSAAYFNRAVAYERLGDLGSAAQDYAALHALEPNYPGLKARMQELGLLQQ